MQSLDYQLHKIPVEGGVLSVGEWGNTGPVLLCSHGITANHLSFLDFARQTLGEFRLLAPDHRGRGLSASVAGPYSMEAHARDLVAVLDYFNIERAPAHIGHSMGAFIGVVAKALYSDRLGELILVDGGLPLADELPQGLTTQQVVEAVIGPSMARLDMSFESGDAYLDFWKAHPAFTDSWSESLEQYFLADLVGQPPALRSGVNKEAILGDTASQLMSNTVADSLPKIASKLYLLRAPRGIMDDEPLYSNERIIELGDRLLSLVVTNLEDVNHYTIMLGEKGAAQVAAFVRELFADKAMKKLG